MWLAALRGLKEPIPAGALCSVLPSSLLHYSGNTGNSPRVLNVGGVTLLHCYRVTLLPCGHISSIVGVCAVGPLCRLLSPLHLISRRCTELSLSLREWVQV